MPDAQRLQVLATAAEPRAAISRLFFLSPGESVGELLLIRHAQVKAGDAVEDSPLTALGREQAHVLATYLARGRKLDALYASPTARTRQTAAPIAEQQGLDIEIIEDLRDIDMLRPFDRPFEEMLASEVGAENVEHFIERLRRESTLDAMAPFMQSSASFRERVINAIDALLARHPGERIVAVTHGPVIMAYAMHLLGSPRDFAIQPGLTSITRVLAQGDRRTLDYLNALPHFEVI